MIGFFERLRKVSRYLFLNEPSGVPIIEMDVDFSIIGDRPKVEFKSRYLTDGKWKVFFTCTPGQAKELSDDLIAGLDKQRKQLGIEEYLDYDMRDYVS